MGSDQNRQKNQKHYIHIQVLHFRLAFGQISAKNTRKLPVSIKEKKDLQRNEFFDTMKDQIIKHNRRYLKGMEFLISIFAEQKTGSIIGKFIRGIPQTIDNEESSSFHSEIHQTNINLQEFYFFLQEYVRKDELELYCAQIRDIYIMLVILIV